MKRFFSTERAGLIIGVVSLFVGVYLYSQSIRERELTYFVHPVKSVVVRAGELSDISVALDGKTIKSDITVAQIAFWNAGKESIRESHVLKPFLIQTEGNVPILEARIRKQTREVVNLQVDRSHLNLGKVGISWSILEQNDGGILQLIFVGDANVDIVASAVIEGQPKLRPVEFHQEINTPVEQYESIHSETLRGAIISLVMGLGIVFILIENKSTKPRSKRNYAAMIVGIILAMLFLLAGISFLLDSSAGPPFGFD